MTPGGIIDAQFDAILRSKDGDPDLRRKIAKAQREQFGFKTWDPSKPTTDAMGDRIMYMDSDGGRYTVHNVRGDGLAHVRRDQGPAGFLGRCTTIQAVAPTEAEAAAVAELHRLEREEFDGKPLELKKRDLVLRLDGLIGVRYELARVHVKW